MGDDRWSSKSSSRKKLMTLQETADPTNIQASEGSGGAIEGNNQISPSKSAHLGIAKGKAPSAASTKIFLESQVSPAPSTNTVMTPLKSANLSSSPEKLPQEIIHTSPLQAIETIESPSASKSTSLPWIISLFTFINLLDYI